MLITALSLCNLLQGETEYQTKPTTRWYMYYQLTKLIIPIIITHVTISESFFKYKFIVYFSTSIYANNSLRYERVYLPLY